MSTSGTPLDLMLASASFAFEKVRPITPNSSRSLTGPLPRIPGIICLRSSVTCQVIESPIMA